jgi:hypothetical protein
MNIECLAQYVPVMKDIILTLTAVIASIVALLGLNTWNRQLRGQVEYELTRKLLKSAFKIREALKIVRNPVMFGYEQPAPEKADADKMTYDQIRHYGTARAYQARWDKVNEARAELQTDLLEAEVIWGDVIPKKFSRLFELQVELFSIVQSSLVTMDPNQPQTTRNAYQEIMKTKRDIMYDLSSADKPDEFTNDVTNAVKAIEEHLMPHLHRT